MPDSALLLQTDDMRTFRHAYLNWFWGSYTAVYLGVAVAAYDELRRIVQLRQPAGYAQPLAYHPDVRRHVAELSADLEAARLITYRSAWLRDIQGPTAETTAALYRAKYVVGETVSRITRIALTLAARTGFSRARASSSCSATVRSHRSSRHRPISASGTWEFYELGLDAADIVPPLRLS